MSAGAARTRTITGGFVSITVTVVLHTTVFVLLSVAVTSITFVPSGKMAVNETLVPASESAPGIILVCIARPLTDQTTPRSLPAGSETFTVISFVELHGTVAGSGHVMIGAA